MNKDCILKGLDKIFPIGAWFNVVATPTINSVNKAKKKLPKFGKWKYICTSYTTIITFVFERIK